MKDGFLRVAVATPEIRVADPSHNAGQIIRLAGEMPPDTALAVFPELCVTGYTCGDLFLQPLLLREAEQAVVRILDASLSADALLVVGVPVPCGASLYNCAAVCQHGKLLGLVPKSHIPSYSEYYEGRHFTPADDTCRDIFYAGQDTILSRSLLFVCRNVPDFRVGVEVCEDLWVADQPSSRLASAGATVIANLSASDESVGKDEFRRQIAMTQSARLCCAYVYADAGEGESTGDLVFSGQNMIVENGVILAESERFTTGLLYTEVDLARLAYERRRLNTFTQDAGMKTVGFELPERPLALTRKIDPHPFVPSAESARRKRCEDILTIQAAGLAARLRHTGCKAVLGLSGGLDSALALLVACRAYDRLNRPRADIRAVTMPCFGTTGRTLQNARRLARACGAELSEVEIGETVRAHLRDIGHDGRTDVAYENAQARERTQVLMDMANMENGLVVGTGDLSELALGWATYNGDHMSMYGVNCGIPKTLVRHLVGWVAAKGPDEAARPWLLDILDTPISPELLPADGNGQIAQCTEELVGPYDLHDFFLYYFVRFGFRPAKLYLMARQAFAGKYEDRTIKRWLITFLRRFFSQQFKRSALPDGPKVGSVSLSPRGDWRMPSDASCTMWLHEAENL